MRDMFGQDAVASDGASPSTDGTEAATAAVAATPAGAPAGGAPAAAPAAAAAAAPPTVQQAVDKAQAKVAADAAVAVDPHAVHHVKLAAAAPTVLGSTATGAVIGMGLGGPPGALLGAGAGWVVERYQIGGGPVGKLWNGLKKHLTKPKFMQHQGGGAPAAAAPAAAPMGTTAATATMHGEHGRHGLSAIEMGDTNQG